MNIYDKENLDWGIINNAISKASEEEEELEEETIEDIRDDEEEQDAEIRNEAWRMCQAND